MAKKSEAKAHTARRSAGELLANWRGAERDSAAAETAASLAKLVLDNAMAVEEAATATKQAADAASEASQRAIELSKQARKLAMLAAETAQMQLSEAEGSRARSNHATTAAHEIEAETRQEFLDAQSEGFPKE